MSKYSKMLFMKDGSNVMVKTAAVGMFAKLLGLGARRGVEMLTPSKKYIQAGAEKAAKPEKFKKATEAYEKGHKEMLNDLKLKDFE